MEQIVKDALDEAVERFCNGEKQSDDIILATVSAAISVDGFQQGDEVELSQFQLADPPISWRVKMQVEAGDVVRIVLSELFARDMARLRVQGTVHLSRRDDLMDNGGDADGDVDLGADSNESTCSSSSRPSQAARDHPLRGQRSPVVVVTDHPITIASVHRSAVSQVGVHMASFYLQPGQHLQDADKGDSSEEERCTEAADCDEVSLQMLARLSADFGHLLSTQGSSDVVLRVGELPVKAHKAVLVARSEVFRQLLEQDDRQGDDAAPPSSLQQLRIADAPREAFLKVLRYMYTADVSALSDCETDVLVLAARFGLTDLADECCRRLLVALDADNGLALDLLAFAEQHGVAALKARALLVVVEHLGEVTATQRWRDYKQRMPSLAADLLETAARVLVLRKP
ncbi:uncharacterized protein LOC117639708 [Thrips palmi]|uniref:Uncharacterized protein LOC117639708 n=1 Tax=Thrips palmi TaxID=161013 RepID=A0A6P8Y4V1_THRPL|nr:uncharacterized protein LOC117639708 [Thrips palmi]